MKANANCLPHQHFLPTPMLLPLPVFLPRPSGKQLWNAAIFMIDLGLVRSSSIFTRKFNVSIANLAETAVSYINDVGCRNTWEMDCSAQRFSYPPFPPDLLNPPHFPCVPLQSLPSVFISATRIFLHFLKHFIFQKNLCI